MLGYDISWGAFNVIEVMSSTKFTFKVRVGKMYFQTNVPLTVKETIARQKRDENKFGKYVCVTTRHSGDQTS